MLTQTTPTSPHYPPNIAAYTNMYHMYKSMAHVYIKANDSQVLGNLTVIKSLHPNYNETVSHNDSYPNIPNKKISHLCTSNFSLLASL